MDYSIYKTSKQILTNPILGIVITSIFMFHISWHYLGSV